MLGIISVLALFFLTLFGYSAGSTYFCRKSSVEPDTFDLVLTIALLVAAFVADAVTGYNRWWLVGGTLFVSAAVSSLKMLVTGGPALKSPERPSATGAKMSLWNRWLGFSKRTGGFQARIFLSFLYLIVFVLVAVPMKLFSDPLRTKLKPDNSYWSERPPRETIETAGKQY